MPAVYVFLKRISGKFRAVAALCCLAALFCACGSTAQPAVKPEETKKLAMATGTVTQYSQSSLTLDTGESELSFTLVNDTAVVGGQLEAGTEASVFYYESGKTSPDAARVRIYPMNALSRAKLMLSEMTLEEKVGQLFIARFPAGTAEVTGAQAIEDYHLGGFVLFARDFKNRTPQETAEWTSELQSMSDIPLLLAVDEEGGEINRISCYSQYRETPFGSPQELYADGGLDEVASDTAEKSAFLKALGINVNMAPVCDVSTDPDDYIYDRALGQDAGATSEYVKTVVETMAGTGVGCVLKHFPGYGSNADTHTALVRDSRDYETFETSDLLPFRAGIDAGAECVLVSHNIVECIDPDAPASLSSAVHELLRNELGFNGVIITDELSMKGITDFCGGEEAAVKAVLAGNDLLCCTDFASQYEAVLSAVGDGKITEERIDESVTRILCWKIELGLIA